MRSYHFSGSSYGRARLCAASTVLPRAAWISPAASMGSALHEHMADRVNLGVDGAFARLPEIVQAWEFNEDEERIFIARCRSFKFYPPNGAIAEYPLALMADGSVLLCRGGKGEYEAPAGAILPLTLDVMWSEPDPLEIIDGLPVCPPGSVLWTPDYKSGSDENPDPIEHNRQALATALIAGRLTGAEYVFPAIVYIRSGEGEWDTLEKPLTLSELSWVEQEIRETHARCAEQKLRLEQGERVQTVEGSHCTHCGARSNCPAKTAMIRSVLTGEIDAPGLVSPLSDEHRLKLAMLLPQLDRWSRAAKEALIADVDAHGPVLLGEGRVWGPHETSQDEIDPWEGVAVLTDEIGEEAARAALSVELPKGSVHEAIRSAHMAQGIKRKVSEAERRFYAKAKERGALRKKVVVKYEVHKVQDAPSEAEALPAITENVETDGT